MIRKIDLGAEQKLRSLRYYHADLGESGQCWQCKEPWPCRIWRENAPALEEATSSETVRVCGHCAETVRIADNHACARSES